MARLRHLLLLLLASAALAMAGPAKEAPLGYKLNSPLAGGKGDVRGASRSVSHPFAISPDGLRVIYLADQDRDEVVELYSVPTAGGSAIKLNRQLPRGGAVGGADPEVDPPFAISPDGRHVVFLADQDAAGRVELYTVPTGGGPVSRLNPPLAGGAGDVRAAPPCLAPPFSISPDSRWVVYLADQDRDEVVELYSVPAAGGPARRLNGPLVEGGQVASGGRAPAFQISPDSQWVVYLADQDHDQVYELYSVPIGGGKVLKLNPTLAGGQGDIQPAVATPFQISPDSRRVVYLADQDRDETFELYSVPIRGPGQAGEAPVKLNSALPAGGDVRGADAEAVDPFRISPDGLRVVYLADQEADEVFELFSVPIAGGPATKLNAPLAGGRGDVQGVAAEMPNPFRISPDSRRVIYLADQEADEVFELFSVPIGGGPVVKLNPLLAGGKGDVRGAAAEMANPFLISPDSQRVIYLADQEKDGAFELLSVPAGGGASVKLNPTLAGGRGQIRGADNAVAHPFRITPDSRRVLYLADQREVGVMELYAVSITGGPATRLNADLAAGQGAIVGADYEVDQPFLISPDGGFAVYLADQETDEVIEIFASPIAPAPASAPSP